MEANLLQIIYKCMKYTSGLAVVRERQILIYRVESEFIFAVRHAISILKLCTFMCFCVYADSYFKFSSELSYFVILLFYNGIEEQAREGEILACVPKSGNLYEVTLNENSLVDLMLL